MSFKMNDFRTKTKKLFFVCLIILKIWLGTLNSSNDEVLKNHFKQTQKITAEACGVSLMTVRRVCVKGSYSSDVQESPGPSFTSPRKTYKRKKYTTELDDFDDDIVRRTVHEF